eukprot:12433373-Alexandrium_andersonii.AAC.1
MQEDDAFRHPVRAPLHNVLQARWGVTRPRRPSNASAPEQLNVFVLVLEAVARCPSRGVLEAVSYTHLRAHETSAHL